MSAKVLPVAETGSAVRGWLGRLRRALRTTAVRLTILYTLLFGILAVGVVAYISFQTGRLVIAQIRSSLEEEVQSLERVARSRGLRRLIAVVDRRSRAPGANLYLIIDQTGRILTGNVADVDRAILRRQGFSRVPFVYRRFDAVGDAEGASESRAIARTFTLPGGLRLLVGRDIGEAARFRTVVLRASSVSLLILLFTAVMLWFFVARRALVHIDEVSATSRRIIAGDLSQRLPLSGSGDEFDRLSEALNEALARIEKLDASARDISDNIAHDLRTPLTRLRNQAETVLRTAQRDETREQARAVIEEADGLITTFEALLMISRIESGSRAARFEDTALHEVVADVVELFEPAAEEQGVTLTLGMVEPVVMPASRALVAQGLTNLIDNALKYAGSDGGTVTVSLECDAQAAVLSVRDEGPGIPPAERETALRRFGRLERARSQSGSGLGLSLVEAIASVHGGTVELDDASPGLIVRLRLPLGVQTP